MSHPPAKRAASADPLEGLLQDADASVPHPGPGALFDPELARRRLLRRTLGRSTVAVASCALATWLCWGWPQAVSPSGMTTPPPQESATVTPTTPRLPSLASRLARIRLERWGSAFDRLHRPTRAQTRRRIEQSLVRAHLASQGAARTYARSRAIAAYSARSLEPASPDTR